MCELALNNESGDKMITLFNAQAQRFENFDTVFHHFKDSELIEMVEFVERDPLLHIVRDLIKNKKGKLNRQDIEKILAGVKPVRDSFAKKCR